MQVYPARSSREGRTPPKLDKAQLKVLRRFQRGHNVAILGGAGSGKSFVLLEILREARTNVGGFPKVAACALTNQAASSMDGMTLHRLFGAPPCWEWSKQHLLEVVRSNPAVLKHLSELEVLVIDEVSQLKANELDAVDYVLRKLTCTEHDQSLPLGGRQLVLSGDPFQLEPTGVDDFHTYFRTAFQSRLWCVVFGGYGAGFVAVLQKNHRQKQDKTFFDILQGLRKGKPSPDHLEVLNGTSSGSVTPPVTHKRLCLYKAEVSRINESFLEKLPGNMEVCTAQDSLFCRMDREGLQRRLNDTSPNVLRVKPGCVVILTRNVGKFLPGTQAVVRDVRRHECREEDNTTAWRGELIVDMLHPPQGELESNASHCSIRMVQFHVYSYDRRLLATRWQLPVIPAYAMTVHKCQGLTLSNVAIDFTNVENWKPNGMVYVALSRCRALSGLWVRGLTMEHISISERAKVLMRELGLLAQYHPRRVVGKLPMYRQQEKENDPPSSTLQDTVYMDISKNGSRSEFPRHSPPLKRQRPNRPPSA